MIQKADAAFNLAFQYFQSGNTTKADELCRKLCEEHPYHARATLILGVIAHHNGRYNESIALLRRAVELDDSSTSAHNNLGVVLCQVGEWEKGIAAYRQALKIMPDYAVAHCNLGGAYANSNRPEEALAHCRKALELKPYYAEAHHNLASAFQRLGQSSDAVEHFEAALKIKPHYAEARLGLCMAELPILFGNSCEIAVRRAAYERRLKALIGDSQIPIADLVNAVGSAQPFQLAYQGCNDHELQSSYGSYVCQMMEKHYPPVELTKAALPDELIRVGIVSGFFRQHSNWKIPIKGWISQLDRRRFKVFGYHTGVLKDDQTAIAAQMCDRFIQGPLSVDGWRKEIGADAPHVLIYPEVGMDPVAVKLAAQRLAPVQCNSWGHPETSGFPTLDYYLTSELMEPYDAAEHYTEELIRLPNLSIYYEPIDQPSISATRSELGMRPSASVFWCGQSLFKYLPQFDRVFPRIARKVPDCQFVFIHFPASAHVKALFRRRLELVFREYDLDFEDHCVFQPQLNADLFAAVMRQCDIVLDPLEWSGCNSTFESLQFNLPIVTAPGSLMRGRHTLAILTMMDVTDTVASNMEEYVAIAARLANDPIWLRQIKEKIARNKGRLYLDRKCISALEDFFVRVASRHAPSP